MHTEKPSDEERMRLGRTEAQKLLVVTLEERFVESLDAYQRAAEQAIQAEEVYRVAHAHAVLHAEAKNAEGRKAEADANTSASRLQRDHAALRRDVALHMVQYLKARAGVSS